MRDPARTVQRVCLWTASTAVYVPQGTLAPTANRVGPATWCLPFYANMSSINNVPASNQHVLGNSPTYTHSTKVSAQRTTNLASIKMCTVSGYVLYTFYIYIYLWMINFLVGKVDQMIFLTNYVCRSGFEQSATYVTYLIWNHFMKTFEKSIVKTVQWSETTRK